MTNTNGSAAGRRTTRATRSTETRVQDGREPIREISNPDWSQPALLDARNIPPRPGYTMLWVRTMIHGEEDGSNIVKSYNAGWRPRKIETVPDPDAVPTTTFRGQQVIGVQGNVLMERPEHITESQYEYFRQTARDQMRAVEEQLYALHKPGRGFSRPEFGPETRHSVTVGSDGRRIKIADD